MVVTYGGVMPTVKIYSNDAGTYMEFSISAMASARQPTNIPAKNPNTIRNAVPDHGGNIPSPKDL